MLCSMGREQIEVGVGRRVTRDVCVVSREREQVEMGVGRHVTRDVCVVSHGKRAR